jgi:hypothetical protein
MLRAEEAWVEAGAEEDMDAADEVEDYEDGGDERLTSLFGLNLSFQCPACASGNSADCRSRDRPESLYCPPVENEGNGDADVPAGDVRRPEGFTFQAPSGSDLQSTVDTSRERMAAKLRAKLEAEAQAGLVAQVILAAQAAQDEAEAQRPSKVAERGEAAATVAVAATAATGAEGASLMAMEVVATKAADLVEAHSVLPGMPPTGLLGAKAMEGAFLMDEEDEECLEGWAQPRLPAANPDREAMGYRL